jgi:hypothetical protein
MEKRTKEYWLEYNRKWREAKKNDPEYREKRKANAKRYYAKNKEQIRAKEKDQRQNDPEYKRRRSEENKKWKERLKQDPIKLEEFKKKSREYHVNLNANLTEEQKEKRRERERAYSKTEARKIESRKSGRKNYQTRTQWAIQMFGGKCMQCGIVDHPVVYDFHHVDPSTKLFDISKYISSIGIVKLIAELSKCILLCSHCHRKITFGLEALRCKIESIDWDIDLLKAIRSIDILTSSW